MAESGPGNYTELIAPNQRRRVSSEHLEKLENPPTETKIWDEIKRNVEAFTGYLGDTLNFVIYSYS